VEKTLSSTQREKRLRDKEGKRIAFFDMLADAGGGGGGGMEGARICGV
jgi:hypothetical protein